MLSSLLSNLSRLACCALWLHTKCCCCFIPSAAAAAHSQVVAIAFKSDGMQHLPACFTIVTKQLFEAQGPQPLCLVQDVVTRGSKFVFLYKQPGHRVIVNSVGHMMVSPSSIEASMQQSPCTRWCTLLLLPTCHKGPLCSPHSAPSSLPDHQPGQHHPHHCFAFL